MGSSETGTGQSPEGAPAAQESASKFFSRLGPAGPLAIVSLMLPPLSGFLLIAYMQTASEWLRSHGTLGLVIYLTVFIVCSGLAIMPTYAQSALGGFAFSMKIGVPAALVGFAGGALIGYEIAKRASGDRVVRVLKEHPKWMAVRDALVKDHDKRSFWKTVGMVALLRCPPNSPFALTNLVMASVQVPRIPFLLGTVLGMAPRTGVAVVIGSSVGTFTNESLREAAPKWLLPVSLVVSFAILGVAMWIGHRAVARIQRDHRPNGSASTLATQENT